jgi:hypothetical protein
MGLDGTQTCLGIQKSIVVTESYQTIMEKLDKYVTEEVINFLDKSGNRKSILIGSSEYLYTNYISISVT